MSTDLSVFFLLGILSRASRAMCPDMEVFNGSTKVSNIPCIKYFTDSCSNRNIGPPYNLSRDPVVSEPRDLKATTFSETEIVDPIRFEYHGVNMTWKAPSDEFSQRNTEGYCVISQTLDKKASLGLGFDMREFSFVGKTNFHFILRVYPLSREVTQFYVTLYTLPPRDAKDVTTTQLITMEKPRLYFEGTEVGLSHDEVKEEEGTGMKVAIIISIVLFVVAIVLWASKYKQDWMAVKRGLDNSETVTQTQKQERKRKPGTVVIVE